MTAPMLIYPKTLDYGATDPRLPNRPLGRQIAVDRRDGRFPLGAITPDTLLPSARYWPVFAPPIYQGSTPRCVPYSGREMLVGNPVQQAENVLDHTFCHTLYKLCQDLDEWEGSDYDGTSVRALMKALRQMGYIREFHWAETEEDIYRYVMTKGIVVMGTDWTWDMCFPDKDGYVYPTGEVIGGHAWAIVGASAKRGAYRAFTPWEDFGTALNGRFWIKRSDVHDLHMSWGEASATTEIKVA